MDIITLKCLSIHTPTLNLIGVIQSGIHTEPGFFSLPPSLKQTQNSYKLFLELGYGHNLCSILL